MTTRSTIPPSAALLGALLIHAGVLTEEQLDEALAEQREKGGRLGELLRARSWVTSSQIAQALASQYGFPYIDLAGTPPEAAVADELPAGVTRRHRVLPIRVDSGRLIVALADPSDADAVSAVRAATRLEVRFAVADEEALTRLLGTQEA